MSRNRSQVLERLHAMIGNDLVRTNQIITEQLDSQVEMIPELGSHLINSGGKRLRPILTLIASRLFGYQGNQHAVLAAVIEFIHTATLLHDDVVDKSITRRGRASANALWGNKAPVLVGDFLFSRSFQILVDLGNIKVLKIIADACAVISEGEVMQLVVTKNLETTESQYMEVVSSKTATLFSAATQLGAVVNQRPEGEERHLARYGLLLGNAFQVVDDALDYSANQETLGKTVGDDFNEGKLTLPLIHAYAHSSAEERAFWQACIERGETSPENLARAIGLVRERGSLDYAMAKARQYAQEAKAELQSLPATPERDALEAVADFSVDRDY